MPRVVKTWRIQGSASCSDGQVLATWAERSGFMSLDRHVSRAGHSDTLISHSLPRSGGTPTDPLGVKSRQSRANLQNTALLTVTTVKHCPASRRAAPVRVCVRQDHGCLCQATRAVRSAFVSDPWPICSIWKKPTRSSTRVEIPEMFSAASAQRLERSAFF